MDNRLYVAVDTGSCRLYGYCAQVAPGLFDLTGDRLRYPRRVDAANEEARAAARSCPTRAIHLSSERFR